MRFPLNNISCVIVCLLAVTGRMVAEDKVSYNFQIKPILAEHCFKCHGQDEKERKGKLRLDVREAAMEKKAIIPGNASESELIKRLLTHDEEDIMPPPKERKPVSEANLALLKKWIAQGAEYQRHWSFIAPVKPVLPRLTDEGGRMKDEKVPASANPIDSFVLAQLEKAGTAPAAPADREIWLRRVTINLTGLPPTLAEQDAFLQDHSAGAEARVVDRLLSSPSFGEQVAVDWLDAARFADTYGRHEDEDSEVWPWRDWVIRAFNTNLPYDQFITQQTAGDMLPNATLDNLIATTFNRLVQQSSEAGSNEEEFRCEHIADRVKTNTTAFLGLTMECARCHDHKYDPLSQKDYYSLGAFLNNIDELGLYSRFTNGTPSPTTLLYKGDEQARHQAMLARIIVKEQELIKEKTAARLRFASWIKTRRPPPSKGSVPGTWEKFTGWFFTPPPIEPLPKPVSEYAFERVKDKVIPNLADPANPTSQGPNTLLVKGRKGKKALHFKADSRIEFPNAGNFKRTDSFTIAFWLKLGAAQDHCVVIHKSRSGLEAAHRGYEVSLDKSRPLFMMAHFWPGNGFAIRAKKTLTQNEWYHLTATYDGSSKAAGAKLYLNGKALEVEVLRDQLDRDINYRAEWGDLSDDKVPDLKTVEKTLLTAGGRINDTGMLFGSMDELLIYDRALSAAEINRISGGEEALRAADWLEWYLRDYDEPCKKLSAELKTLREEENEFTAAIKELMIMRDKTGPPRHTYVLKRGQYDMLGDEVKPDVPASILPFPEGAPRNRLGLAQWLVDRKNPLTARVAVNRIWQLFFGRGIVTTTEDFGVQGQLPTHPELLDWLAVWFMDHGWDTKELCKLIVLSSTYGQSSTPSDPALLKDDPENRLLARFPSLRLGAEQVRDAALSLSGVLTRQIGGEPVKPYQPAGVWEESGTQHTYVQDHGEKLTRRSLYSFWRRTMPPPSMTVFDAPTREFCKVRRERTGTPLQALALLNDTQFLEAARVMAEHLHAECGGDAKQIVDKAFRLITSRRISPEQETVLTAMLQDARTYYNQHDKEAGELLAQTGEYPRHPAVPPVEAAAVTMLTRTLLSYDEFVMKR